MWGDSSYTPPGHESPNTTIQDKTSETWNASKVIHPGDKSVCATSFLKEKWLQYPRDGWGEEGLHRSMCSLTRDGHFILAKATCFMRSVECNIAFSFITSWFLGEQAVFLNYCSKLSIGNKWLMLFSLQGSSQQDSQASPQRLTILIDNLISQNTRGTSWKEH